MVSNTVTKAPDLKSRAKTREQEKESKMMRNKSRTQDQESKKLCDYLELILCVFLDNSEVTLNLTQHYLKC